MTTGFQPLSFLILIPVIGALVCYGPWFARERDTQGRLCRAWSLAVSALALALLLAVAKAGVSDTRVVLSVFESRPWLPSLGINLNLLLDGLSFVFCLLTCVVTLAVIAWSSKPAEAGPSWYGLLLLGQSTVLGAFLAADLFVFYCFFELMLLPVLVAMALWGGPRRLQAALRFLLYTIVGSVPMLLSILYVTWMSSEALGLNNGGTMVTFDLFSLSLYFTWMSSEALGHSSGGTNFTFDLFSLSQVNVLSPAQQLVAGLGFLMAFAVKTPIVPLHGWLPETYREAPHGTAAFTAALLGKVGVYGIIRFMYPLFPDFMLLAGPYLAAAGAIAVVYGAMVAMAQRDVRSLLAYSSISHLGFCILGIGVASDLAITGSVFQAVSHGLVTVALFLVFGKVIDREGTRDLDSFGGLAQQIPVSAFFLMVFSIAAVALPLTSSFVGEFLIIMGSWRGAPGWTALALVGVVLGAVYTLTAYLKTMFGPARERSGAASLPDMRGGDVVVAAVLAAAVVVLGVFPQGTLDTIALAVEQQLAKMPEGGLASPRAQMRLRASSAADSADTQSTEGLVQNIALTAGQEGTTR